MSLKVISESAFAAARDAVADVNVPGALAAGAKTATGAASQAAEWVCANPGGAVGAVVVGAGAIAAIAPMAVASPLLGAAGFGSGVVKGSIVAGVQSGIGNVVAHGAFATLQSAGAGGYGVAIVSSVVQATGAGVATGGAGIMAWAKAKL